MEKTREQLLASALYDYHYEAAFRPCASSNAFAAALIANGGQFIPAVTAALACIGGPHGPIKACMRLLNTGYAELNFKFGSTYGKIPGFGSSFAEGPDPLLQPIHKMLVNNWTNLKDEIDDCTYRVKEHTGKPLHPNGAFYTGITAILTKVPDLTVERLFTVPRINAWADLAPQIMERKDEK